MVTAAETATPSQLLEAGKYQSPCAGVAARNQAATGAQSGGCVWRPFGMPFSWPCVPSQEPSRYQRRQDCLKADALGCNDDNRSGTRTRNRPGCRARLRGSRRARSWLGRRFGLFRQNRIWACSALPSHVHRPNRSSHRKQASAHTDQCHYQEDTPKCLPVSP